ncbi:MAG: hypothetical protein ABIR80_21595 [Opitutaceae bacterium]
MPAAISQNMQGALVSAALLRATIRRVRTSPEAMRDRRHWVKKLEYLTRF